MMRWLIVTLVEVFLCLPGHAASSTSAVSPSSTTKWAWFGGKHSGTAKAQKAPKAKKAPKSKKVHRVKSSQ
jgi:hypothetical protein